MGEHGTPGEPDRGSGLVLDDGTLRITWRSGEPPIMVLAGEVDEASYPGLVAALTGAAAHYDEIHLDLAGLGYCDLAGLRAIVRLASPDGPTAARSSRWCCIGCRIRCAPCCTSWAGTRPPS